MRRTRRTYLATISVLIVLTVIVVFLNYNAPNGDDDAHEHEIAPKLKIDTNEYRRKRDLSLKETWMKRRASKSSSNATFSGIYVREAYRVADDEIRFVYLENQDNSINLKAEVASVGWQPVEWSCFNATCFDILFCSMATRFGSVRLPPSTPHSPFLHLTSEMNDEYSVIPVTDVRVGSSAAYPHALGVCLQPIFFSTDWTIIIQFLESWLAQGATKFYFYVHSYTWQTKRVLDFYKRVLGDDLQLIEWSDLPVPRRQRGEYERDPNSRVFRHAATAFMHDCMMRARGQVKFVANTDLDDLPVAANLNLTSTLDTISQRHPNAAQFKVDWILSHQPQYWDAINRPSDVTFDLHSVRVLQTENIRWDYRVSKKMFHRPERVVHFDMHSVYRNEIFDDQHQYTTIELFDSPSIFFLHLRRFERHLLNPPVSDYNNSFDYSLLLKLNEKMRDQYLKRIESTDFSEHQLSPWALEARLTMRDLEQCRREAFGTILDDKNEMCQQSSAGCEGMLSARVRFIRTSQTWTNIAHKALFNSYVEKTRHVTLF